MNGPSQSHYSSGPVYGLILVGLAAVFMCLLSALCDVAPLTEISTGTVPNQNCVYEIVDNGACVGALFAGQPETLARILERFSLGHRISPECESAAIPCGTRITLNTDRATVSREKISGVKLIAGGKPVNLNLADESDLIAVPGIGPSLARKIIRQRDAKGGFSSLEELRQVPGMGKKKLETLERWLVVDEFVRR